MITVHHIGYLVKNIDKAIEAFKALGYESGADEHDRLYTYDSLRGVNIAFLSKDGYTTELVSPVTESSVVAGLIKKYKNMPYHMCYASDDFAADLAYLEKSGFTRIDEPAPAPALSGKNVCFLMSPRIGIIELLEN